MSAAASSERPDDRIRGPAGYRAASDPVDDIALLEASLTIDLLSDPDRARFCFECRVVSSGGAATGEWRYDIPAERAEVREHSATDAHGNLQTELRSTDGECTRLHVRLRRLVERGEAYPFQFTYEAPVRAVVTTGAFSRTVAYSGWSILSLQCQALSVTIDGRGP